MKIASKYFEDLVEEQGFLDTEEHWSKMLALVPEKKRLSLHEEWRGRPQDSGRVRWQRLASDVMVSSLWERRGERFEDVFFRYFRPQYRKRKIILNVLNWLFSSFVRPIFSHKCLFCVGDYKE